MRSCYEKDDFYFRIHNASLNENGEAVIQFPRHFVRERHHVSFDGMDYDGCNGFADESWKVALTRVGLDFQLRPPSALPTVRSLLMSVMDAGEDGGSRASIGGEENVLHEVLLCADFCEKTPLVRAVETDNRILDSFSSVALEPAKPAICFVPLLRTLSCELFSVHDLDLKGERDCGGIADNSPASKLNHRVPLHDCLRLLYPDVSSKTSLEADQIQLFIRRADGEPIALSSGSLSCELHFLRC